MGAPPTKEYSHGSSSSSSSQFDDVMESLPEIDDRSFALPRMNSLKTFQQDDKQSLQNLARLGSSNFDWASLAGLGSLPELVPGVQAQSQSQAPVINSNCDIYVPSMCQSRFGRTVEEEVESVIRNQRVDNSGTGFFQQNPNGYSQSFSNSTDPFGIGYQIQQNSGFRQ